MPPAVGTPDEEEPSVGRVRHLVAQVSFDLVGQAASGYGVSRPEAAVLDEEPVVDSAGGRAERLVVLARQARHCARTRGCDLVLHLHRLDNADDLARLDLIAFGDLDREDGALHRRDDRVAGSAVMSALCVAVPAPSSELRVRRLRLEKPDLEAPTLYLCPQDLLAKPSVRRRHYASCPMRQLLRAFRQALRLGHPATRLSGHE